MTKPSQPRPTNISSSLSAISFGPADDRVSGLAAAGEGDEIARARVGLARGLQHAVADAYDALHAFEFLRGQRFVDALGGEIVVQPFRQQRQGVDFQRQFLYQRHLVFGFRFRGAAHRRGQVAEKYLVGIAARFGGFVAHGVIALFGAGQIARRGEDHLAPAPGKTLAAAAGAGLDDDGMALLRARHRERPARLVELAAMIEALDLGRIGEPAALLVDQERAVFPAIPVAEHDFHEFVGAIVAEIVIEMGVFAHVVGFAVIDRCHHVPGGAAAGHQIQRGEAAGDVERFVIGGGAGRGEAEFFGRHAHRRQHDDGIHLHAADAVFDGMGVVVAVAVRHRQPVVEERHVEFSGLQDPADLLIIIRRHRIVARFRVAPGAWQVGAVLGLQEADHHHLPCHAALLWPAECEGQFRPSSAVNL